MKKSYHTLVLFVVSVALLTSSVLLHAQSQLSAIEQKIAKTIDQQWSSTLALLQ